MKEIAALKREVRIIEKQKEDVCQHRQNLEMESKAEMELMEAV